MAVNKFLTRIVTPDIVADSDMASKLHSYTHGINSDPLTILAILFSALVHDVDHRGVSVSLQTAHRMNDLTQQISHTVHLLSRL